MTSRFPKLTLKFVTDSSRLVMATFACECIQSGPRRHARANRKHNSESACRSEGSEFSVARRRRGLNAVEVVRVPCRCLGAKGGSCSVLTFDCFCVEAGKCWFPRTLEIRWVSEHFSRRSLRP